MKNRGINYDIGTPWDEKISSRPEFDPLLVEKEMAVIANQLHCNAVRISGFDVERLIQAARYAHDYGLAVWLSPTLINTEEEELLSYLATCAKQAASLLKTGEVVFVVGCEWTVFTRGLLPGCDMPERVKLMASPRAILKQIALVLLRVIAQKDPRPEVTQFHRRLSKAAALVRAAFPGKLTYAAGDWEDVDWQPFDIVGIDYYRQNQSREAYLKKLAEYQRHGKPVVVTEFGCATYRGADKLGGRGWQAVEWRDGKPFLKEGLIRDEQMQADYITEQLSLFEAQAIEGAFVYTFISPTSPYATEPEQDFDIASYGIVRPTGVANQRPGTITWQPKAAFLALADAYQ